MAISEDIVKLISSATDKTVILSNLDIHAHDLEEILVLLKKTHPDIKNIYLDHNHLTDAGAIILAEQLKNLDKLSFIDLQFNEIGRAGAERIFTLRKKLPELKIALAGNKIEDASTMNSIERVSRLS